MAQPAKEQSGPKLVTMNNAQLHGKDHPEMQELLQRPAVFMTGHLYGQKNRRNTLDGDWKRAELSWLDWLKGAEKSKSVSETWGLSRHPVAKVKEGSCFVPADAYDGSRGEKAIHTVYALVIDVDGTASLDDTLDRLEDESLFAVVSTSFRHMTRQLELNHDTIVKKIQPDGPLTTEHVREYLRDHHKDRYGDSIIDAAELIEARHKGHTTLVKVPPIEKFRIIVPLWEPVVLADLGATMQEYKDAYADAVCGFAVDTLGIDYDGASGRINQVYFNPRHPADAEDWYCAVVQGRPLRFDEITPRDHRAYAKNRGATDDPFAAVGGSTKAAGDGSGEHETFVTESGFDLNKWHKKHKGRFLIADVIESYCADKVRVAGGEKAGTVHLECVYEHEHSSEGGTATMAMNPDECESGYWTIFCRHDACHKRHKLEHLKAMLDEGWFPESVLTDDEWNIPLPDEDVSSEYEDPDEYLPSSYVRGEDMIFFQSTNDEGETVNIPVCGVFELHGRTMNEEGDGEAGRVISFDSESGKRVTLTISRAELYAHPKNVWEQLADAGLPLAGRDKKAEDRVLNLLAEMTPQRQITTLHTPGVIRGDSGSVSGFMLPNGIPMMRSEGGYRLHEDSTIPDKRAGGTRAGWTAAANAAMSHVDENPYWTLAACSTFTGPLLGVLDWNPLGFNFSGPTSKGKSLGEMLCAAGWGNPADGKSVFWGGNSTPNGWEDLAVYGSGTCLCVDELGAMQDKRVLAPLMFALHSGRGKVRKRGNGAGLTKTAEFRPFVLFSSESSIKAEVEAAGIPYRGGMAVRFPDVDVSEGKDRTSDELSKIEACKANYGHAGPAFVEHLFSTGVVDDPAKLEKEVNEIVATLADGKTPGLKRAARPFALAQRAGELACDAGLLDDKEAVRKGVRLCWEIFLKSDEAATANGNESLMDGFVSWVNSQMDITIIPANGIPGHEPSNSDGRGRVIGWYTDKQIIFDWKALEAMDIPNTFGKRQALTTALSEIEALDRSGDRNIPYTSLPPEVGALPDGGDKRVKNMRVWRDKLGI